MKKRSSASARIFAATALALAFLIAVIAIGGALSDDDSGDSGRHGSGGQSSNKGARVKRVPATYEVESGDTLTSIAHRTGVSVAQIEQLNPEVDPQILVAGEKLKLK